MLLRSESSHQRGIGCFNSNNFSKSTHILTSFDSKPAKDHLRDLDRHLRIYIYLSTGFPPLFWKDLSACAVCLFNKFRVRGGTLEAEAVFLCAHWKESTCVLRAAVPSAVMLLLKTNGLNKHFLWCYLDSPKFRFSYSNSSPTARKHLGFNHQTLTTASRREDCWNSVCTHRVIVGAFFIYTFLLSRCCCANIHAPILYWK